jgi:hypothetical protein
MRHPDPGVLAVMRYTGLSQKRVYRLGCEYALRLLEMPEWAMKCIVNDLNRQQEAFRRGKNSWPKKAKAKSRKPPANVNRMLELANRRPA